MTSPRVKRAWDSSRDICPVIVTTKRTWNNEAVTVDAVNQRVWAICRYYLALCSWDDHIVIVYRLAWKIKKGKLSAFYSGFRKEKIFFNRVITHSLKQIAVIVQIRRCRKREAAQVSIDYSPRVFTVPWSYNTYTYDPPVRVPDSASAWAPVHIIFSVAFGHRHSSHRITADAPLNDIREDVEVGRSRSSEFTRNCPYKEKVDPCGIFFLRGLHYRFVDYLIENFNFNCP